MADEKFAQQLRQLIEVYPETTETGEDRLAEAERKIALLVQAIVRAETALNRFRCLSGSTAVLHQIADELHYRLVGLGLSEDDARPSTWPPQPMDEPQDIPAV